MVKVWSVIFEGSKPDTLDDFMVCFVDLSDAIGDYLYFKPKFAEKLAETIHKYDHYAIIGNIKDVSAPTSLNVPVEGYYVLSGTHKKTDITVSVLMIITPDGKGVVVGVHPYSLAMALKEQKDLLPTVLGDIVDSPENWEQVALIASIKLMESLRKIVGV